jgi:CheY-like chemotaxis protein
MADGIGPAGRVRVLLVEDHVDTARATVRLLERSGYQVTWADSVAAALRQVAEQPPDIVVSDLGLPDGDGHALMRQIKDRYELPGIALSGFGMENDIKHGREAGFVEHLVKPVDVATLDQAIRRVARLARPAGPRPLADGPMGRPGRESMATHRVRPDSLSSHPPPPWHAPGRGSPAAPRSHSPSPHPRDCGRPWRLRASRVAPRGSSWQVFGDCRDRLRLAAPLRRATPPINRMLQVCNSLNAIRAFCRHAASQLLVRPREKTSDKTLPRRHSSGRYRNISISTGKGDIRPVGAHR